MGWDSVFDSGRRTARKVHECDASYWINEYINQGMFSFEEYRIIAKAKRENFKILPKTKYDYQVGIFDGRFAEFKGRSDLCEICYNHELWNDY